jgi:hypothetical protein
VGKTRNAYEVGKLERKRSFGRRRSRGENNIKMNLKEIGFGLD